jgi:acetyltransferase-like isoleucine patch superfamily enzyme
MDRKKELENFPHLLAEFAKLNELNVFLESKFKETYDRSLPLPDHINDRWERAQRLGFGKGTNIYDSSYVIGDVKVGTDCWIGMFTVIDGSGGLVIGNNCTISAGVHIYTHDNLKATLSGNSIPIERERVVIGNNCYIAPHSIISKGVNLGDRTVVAAHSFVNRSFPENAIVAGVPAKQIGNVISHNNEISFEYFNNAK